MNHVEALAEAMRVAHVGWGHWFEKPERVVRAYLEARAGEHDTEDGSALAATWLLHDFSPVSPNV